MLWQLAMVAARNLAYCITSTSILGIRGLEMFLQAKVEQEKLELRTLFSTVK
jgi:hypothetical protein